MTTKTVRTGQFCVPGRITTSGRRKSLHLPRDWPWEKSCLTMLTNLRSVCAAVSSDCTASTLGTDGSRESVRGGDAAPAGDRAIQPHRTAWRNAPPRNALVMPASRPEHALVPASCEVSGLGTDS